VPAAERSLRVSSRRNLELKARYPALRLARAAAVDLATRLGGTENQTDTFFHTPRGRLKLREIDGQGAYLIGYDRPDCAGPRLCHYHLTPIADPQALKGLLAAILGVRGEVRKCREIYLWHNVRVHLDDVAGLGRFVEFEAVLSPDDDEATAQARLDEMCRLFGIDPSDHVAGAYADLLGL
jgi:adenylate cyclase class IV